MPSSHSAACAVLVSTLALLLLPAGRTAASSGNVTTATITSVGNISSATVPAGNNSNEMYTCYFCSGRNLLMIHFCPIYWDECHLECGHADAAVHGHAVSGPVSPSAATVLPGEGALDGGDPGDDDECYVMKLYDSGKYVIVSIVKCGEAKKCFLTCGGGEVLTAGNSSSASSPAFAAPFQRPRLADDFQRCGDTVMRRSGDRSERKG
ncbi:hypothetical protein PR202_gb06926 [Eleusine coracana subsp. coracana]|uniref:Uncharacterized protein n=1 Tax=Eleusine coracana subsp. coracana TaxID=191504 RepID=A0AAV5EAS5_ELECO|nr:hypothetical protein QOZ80_2BG0163660 [Eleusine coracana subsp. coracana]KAK3152798.1 hypothetical protein QOZ80_2BG0163750 [Eleusine coracana subsp. coracana]GJN19631.1 hypothetical protein PR202_gb06926 [Eleusine coracana subsp. coracana]